MKRLGRYDILEELGSGGFATVYKARDTKLNRLVAIKVLKFGLSNDPDFVSRFYQEAETVAQFNHPNIVTIYDVGEIEGQLFISMEYVPGRNLQNWLDSKGRPLTIAEALSILRPLAAALDYAHNQGVVHRDIKPGNVMIHEAGGSLHVELTDFGLVKAMESSLAVTKTGQTLGTPEYMAPEQADPNRQHEIGPHTDRYAFGIMAYRMLAGRVPFPGNSISTLNAHANLDVPSPEQFNTDLSERVVAVLIKMLAKVPADRYPTAAVFNQALQAAQEKAGLEQPVPNTRPIPYFKRILNTLSTWPKYGWAMGGMMGIIGIILIVVLLLGLRGLIQDSGSTTRDLESIFTAEPNGVDATAIAVAGKTAVVLTLQAEQIENEKATTTVEARVLTATTNAILTPVPTPTLTPTPTQIRQPTPTDQPTSTQTIDPSVPPLNPTQGNTWTRPADNMVMVYVPAGTFLMGSNPESDSDAFSDEFPQHEVTLDGFWIDQTEVTNEQYALCVQDSSCETSSVADNSSYNGDTQPVVGVSWFDAEDYCTWAGGQLPTEAQWEYAARGDDGRLYPWGNESPTCDLAQFSNCNGITLSVGSFSPAGDSWVRAMDMAGNVWEWVADWYNGDYYENSPGTNPAGPEAGGFRVLRGGGWSLSAPFVRSANRHADNPSHSFTHVGFRCAAPAP